MSKSRIHVPRLQRANSVVRKLVEAYADHMRPDDLQALKTSLTAWEEAAKKLQSLSNKAEETLRLDSDVFINDPDMIGDTELKYWP